MTMTDEQPADGNPVRLGSALMTYLCELGAAQAKELQECRDKLAACTCGDNHS